MSGPALTIGERLASTLDRDRGKLLGFVRRRLGGRLQDQDPEDILSDVVVTLLERADLLAEVENLTAYMITALVRRITDLFRRSRESPMPEGEPPEAAQPAVAEDRLELSRALSLLSAAERAVWVAIELDGFSFAELAEMWGEPLGTLLSRKSRAGKRLRGALAEGEGAVAAGAAAGRRPPFSL